MPTAGGADRGQSFLPSHFEKPSIGELRIEVLECKGLPFLLQFGRVDPYACVIFEGNAARNTTIWNEHDPQWSCYMPRAFKFDITCPYSSIFVSINDDDHGTDDGIGRVVLSLPSFRSHTIYDNWFPLQYGVLKKHTSRRGAVRLRFSVTFASDQLRLMSYLKPIPTFSVPFTSREAKLDSAFAYRGRYNPHDFNSVVFNAHIAEIKQHLLDLVQVLDDIKYYKMPFLSLFWCGLFQLIVGWPYLVFASIPLLLVACMARQYVSIWRREARKARPLLAQPSLLQLNSQLLFGAREKSVRADPMDREELDDEEVNSEGIESDEEEAAKETPKASPKLSPGQTKGQRAKGDPGEGGVTRSDAPSVATPAQAGSSSDGGGPSEDGEEKGGYFRTPASIASRAMNASQGALSATAAAAAAAAKNLPELPWDGQKRSGWQEEIQRLQQEVAEQVERDRQAMTPRDQQTKFTLNPLAPLLRPVQMQMGELLITIRTVRRLLAWTDRFLTMQLCFALLLLSLTLSGVGYLIWLVPWADFFQLVVHLLGLAAFGPHMYWVGLRVQAQREEERRWDIEFARMPVSERSRLLQIEKERLLKEAQEAMEKEVADEEQMSQREKTSRGMRDAGYHVLKMKPNPAVGRLRFLCEPDLTRSRANPLEHAAHRQRPGKATGQSQPGDAPSSSTPGAAASSTLLDLV